MKLTEKMQSLVKKKILQLRIEKQAALELEWQEIQKGWGAK